MVRFLMIAVLMLGANGAKAETCPNYYRFVDFGLEDPDGNLLRGGPVFRVVDVSGAPLLFRDQTLCSDVGDVFTDGHGHPIPVIEQFDYDPAKVGLGLAALRVDVVNDAAEAAEDSAARHREALAHSTAPQIRGSNYLCVDLDGLVSCQILSPFRIEIPLVVYCEEDHCEAPAFVLSDRVKAIASWPRADMPFDALGGAISERLNAVWVYLSEQSSG